MAQDQMNIVVDGQEVAIDDWNTLGTIAGLADDRTFSELLRIPPYDGTNVYRTILPYSQNLAAATIIAAGTIQPTSSANGSVLIYPFRAVIGSRVAVGSSPSLNWYDIRTAVYTSVSGFTATMAIAPNSSGQPRWDLFCAAVAIDVPLGAGVRRIKDASTDNVTSAAETTRLGTSVGVTIIQGTASATPSIPTPPADSAIGGGGTIYYVPIAAVRVPNGFGSTSTVLSGDIRDVVSISPSQSPTMGTARLMPANGNNDQTGVYATDPYGPGLWVPTSGGQRPGVFMPPSWVGKEERIGEVDVVNPSHQSHTNGAIVDSSIDWRGRIIKVTSVSTNSGGGQKFANDPTGSVLRTPFALQGQFNGYGVGLGDTLGADIQVGNSFASDATLVAGSSTVWSYTGFSGNGINSGAVVGLYVSQADGILRWYNNATASNSRWFFWIEATSQFPNR